MLLAADYDRPFRMESLLYFMIHIFLLIYDRYMISKQFSHGGVPFCNRNPFCLRSYEACLCMSHDETGFIISN